MKLKMCLLQTYSVRQGLWRAGSSFWLGSFIIQTDSLCSVEVWLIRIALKDITFACGRYGLSPHIFWVMAGR